MGHMWVGIQNVVGGWVRAGMYPGGHKVIMCDIHLIATLLTNHLFYGDDNDLLLSCGAFHEIRPCYRYKVWLPYKLTSWSPFGPRIFVGTRLSRSLLVNNKKMQNEK